MTLILVGAGGFFGAISRYLVDGWVSSATGGGFPWGTLVVNVTGSFVLGFLFVLLTERMTAGPWLRTSLTIGFVGAYTTFSTLSLETYKLIEGRAYMMAAANGVGSLVLGLVAIYLGVVTGRAV